MLRTPLLDHKLRSIFKLYMTVTGHTPMETLDFLVTKIARLASELADNERKRGTMTHDAFE